MAKVTTDIDIDFANRDLALAGLVHVKASREDRDVLIRHPSGVYFQEIPLDPFSGCASIPYQEAGDLGYFKIDFLNNSLYEDVKNENHLRDLVDREPEWGLLEEREIVAMLAHIGEHFGVVQAIRPQSVDDLAVVLALIRPGKRHLLGQPRSVIDAEIWKSSDEFTFKRAHAIAYAVSITVQMNLLIDKTVEAIEHDEVNRKGLDELDAILSL